MKKILKLCITFILITCLAACNNTKDVPMIVENPISSSRENTPEKQIIIEPDYPIDYDICNSILCVINLRHHHM